MWKSKAAWLVGCAVAMGFACSDGSNNAPTTSGGSDAPPPASCSSDIGSADIRVQNGTGHPDHPLYCVSESFAWRDATVIHNGETKTVPVRTCGHWYDKNDELQCRQWAIEDGKYGHGWRGWYNMSVPLHEKRGCCQRGVDVCVIRVPATCDPTAASSILGCSNPPPLEYGSNMGTTTYCGKPGFTPAGGN